MITTDATITEKYEYCSLEGQMPDPIEADTSFNFPGIKGEDIWTRVKAKQNSQCPSCKYFNDDCVMYCALHPTTACTPAAENCTDFDIKEF